MRIVVPCDLEETKRRIRYGVRLESGPVVFCPSILLASELRGNVEGNTFWVQGTRPHIINAPQRYFTGTLEEYEDQTILEGKFKYSGFYKGIMFAELVLVVFLSVAVKWWARIALFLALALLGAFLGPLFYEKEETAVIDFLNKL